MFGIGWPELLMIGIVAVIVIGPKDLPPLLRQAGRLARSGRQMWDEMRGHFDELTQEADLDLGQREADEVQKKTNSRVLKSEKEKTPKGAA